VPCCENFLASVDCDLVLYMQMYVITDGLKGDRLVKPVSSFNCIASNWFDPHHSQNLNFEPSGWTA
jgi:hypothetical protein